MYMSETVKKNLSLLNLIKKKQHMCECVRWQHKGPSQYFLSSAGLAHRRVLLTVDIKHNGQIYLGLGVHLALVHAPVPLLDVLDPQVPVVAVLRMPDAEALVPGVSVDAGRQDV